MGFKLIWGTAFTKVNTSQASKKELTDAMFIVQRNISDNKEYATIDLREEVANALKVLLLKDNPQLLIKIVDWTPEGNFSTKERCNMRTMVIARYEYEFEKAVSEATDW